MKRRKFLGLLGASVTAPFVPASAAAKVVTKGPTTLSPAAVHAAIYHAQSRAVFSVWGLAQAANMSIDQATAVMEHLAERGILGPLQGVTHGGRWASSQIVESRMLAQVRAARSRQLAFQETATQKQQALSFQVDLTGLIEHLRTIAARYESQRPVVATA
ncbi:MAG: hypothetical protein AAFP98_02995 [Pseudomonadota bacterium]